MKYDVNARILMKYQSLKEIVGIRIQQKKAKDEERFNASQKDARNFFKLVRFFRDYFKNISHGMSSCSNISMRE